MTNDWHAWVDLTIWRYYAIDAASLTADHLCRLLDHIPRPQEQT